MNYYTKNWKDYIYKNEYEYIYDNNYSDCFKFYYEDNKDNLVYSDKLLKEEFEKYYNEKQNYISNYDILISKFNNIQKVELLSYEEEFDNYKKRFDSYTKRLQEEFTNYVNKTKDINIDEVIDVYEQLNIKQTKQFLNDISLLNIDFRLIALNKNRKKYMQVYKNINITNEVNGFLIGYNYYLEQKVDKYDFDFLKNIVGFHDGLLEKIYFFKDNNKLYGKIFFKDGYSDCKWCIKFYDVKIINDNFNDYEEIIDYDYGNYEDYKYYLRLDEHEFIAEKIEVIELKK